MVAPLLMTSIFHRLTVWMALNFEILQLIISQDNTWVIKTNTENRKNKEIILLILQINH